MTTPPATRSCTGCNFYISHAGEDAQAAAYGSRVPFASCAKKGVFLSPMTSQVKDHEARLEHLEATASSCNSYEDTGKPRTVRRRTAGLTVGLQLLSEPDVKEIGPPEASRPGDTCNDCVFFSAEAGARMGISSPLCLARAEVLPNTPVSTVKTPPNCNSYSPRSYNKPTPEQVERLIGGFTVAPNIGKMLEVDDAFGYIIREKIAANKPFEFVEPSTYKTDEPVSDEDKADGIRAWRRLWDNAHKRSVLIPVFDAAYFSEDERKKIPQSGDKEHPELYQDHAGNAYKVATLWFKMDETPCMQGVAGTGKTEFYRYMAWLMQVPFERVSITRSSELDDLAGKMLFENNETVFQPGRIPRAWVKPGVLCLDEPNVGPVDVWQFIRPLTDNSKQLVLDMNNGETVIRHKYCRMGMAINPSWDSRNIGAEPLADADSNRLSHIFVDFPNESIERNIIKNRCKMEGYQIPDGLVDKVMSIAKTLRDMSEAEDLPITWGIRQQIKVARATEYFEIEDCYKMAATDNLEPEVSEMILNVVRAKADPNGVFGGQGSGATSRF